MAHVHLPSCGRDYEWDVKYDSSPPVKAADGHMVAVGTPTLWIYSNGHDGFQAAPWIDEPLGGPGTGAAGTFTIAVWPEQNANLPWGGKPSDLLVLQCKGPDGRKWEICVDINGVITNDWAPGPGNWQTP